MEEKGEITNKEEKETSLLNKKRKNSKKKKNKHNDENLSPETILEISKLTNKIINNEEQEKEQGEVIEKENLEMNNDNKGNVILLVKKTLINFNTSEGIFQKGRINSQNFPEEEKSNSYYVQRYYFFSLFDKGIQMDKESWYSVTPEEISEYISSIITNSSDSSILDGFCGCGGNVISFSKHFKKVIANDLFESKINMTKNNTKIYECPDNIQYYNKDFFDLNLENDIVDYVFLSPPWGGPEYKKDKIYSLKKWMNPDVEKIIEKCLTISKNLIFYLPRNTDLEELANLLNKYDKEEIKSVDNTILFDVKYLNSASKIKAILVLYGPAFNTLEVKLVRKYITNEVFRKNSNKINENKIKKQINILKVIGYSEYIKNFIEFREAKKDYSGNSFLEILEKHFITNILDEDEVKEYDQLCKLKNLTNNDYDNDNYIKNQLMNGDSNINENEKKDKESENNIKLKIDNEFIDIREILSNEEFNKVKQDKYLENI